jgi:membrane protein YdbS with pleckstrin-like domain
MAGQLRPPREQVSRRAITYWAVRAGLGWLAVLAAVAVAVIALPGRPGWLLWTGAAALVAAAVHVTVMPRWRFHVHRWEVTPQAVYTQAGWFNVERRVAPVARIQTVDSERGPLEQLFGITKVTITTASAAGPLKIHGLDADTAARLADQLTADGGSGGPETGDGT